MNRQEAYSIITAVLERYRGLGFNELRARVGTTTSEEFPAPSSARYTIDVSVSWSDPRHRALLVAARIDDQNTFHFDPMEERIHIPNPNNAATHSNVA